MKIGDILTLENRWVFWFPAVSFFWYYDVPYLDGLFRMCATF